MDKKIQLAKKDVSLSKKRTNLAGKRTILAGTRTLLSHIRTSIVFISLAFAFMKLDKTNPIDALTIILFVLSGVFLVLGIIDFVVTKNMTKYVEDNE